jgi:hypothetical protein
VEQPNSWKKMTGQLERPKSRNNRKARATRKLKLSEKPEDQIEPCANLLSEGSSFLDRQRGPNYLNFEYFWGFLSPIHK